jgi:hypothetical protein
MHSHLDRHLAVFADVWFLLGRHRLGELESRSGSARWSVPQFRRERLAIGVRPDRSGRLATRPRRFSPHRLGLINIAHDGGAVGDRQAGFATRINEDNPTFWRGSISSSLELWISVTKKIEPPLRSGLASSGRARSPPTNCVVSMHTPSFSIMSRRGRYYLSCSYQLS